MVTFTMYEVILKLLESSVAQDRTPTETHDRQASSRGNQQGEEQLRSMIARTRSESRG
jgi:hypothetical protein